MADPYTRPDPEKARLLAAANQLEIACLKDIKATDPGYNFVRAFEHVNWVDFESLVQAGKTPEESGLNERFHKIEADLDALGDNVRRAFVSVDTLRAQLRVCLSEIVAILNTQGDKEKEQAKDDKDTLDTKNSIDNKNDKDSKDKEDKEDKEAKEAKEAQDNDKSAKDDKEGPAEKAQKDTGKDLMGAAEKKDDDLVSGRFDGAMMHFVDPLVESEWPGMAPLRSEQRVFIIPEERPLLGERALNQPRTE